MISYPTIQNWLKKWKLMKKAERSYQHFGYRRFGTVR